MRGSGRKKPQYQSDEREGAVKARPAKHGRLLACHKVARVDRALGNNRHTGQLPWCLALSLAPSHTLGLGAGDPGSVTLQPGSFPSALRPDQLPGSVQRLDVYQPAIVVDVPDRHWIGGIVDPGLAVHAERLGQRIGGERLGLWIEAQIASAIELTGPHLAILVGPGRIERRIG